MRNRHRVVWTKGMFLVPQHFQTQDRFFEDTLQFRFSASNYSNWGVTALDIDSESLENGQFRLNKCTGIMSDGELIDIPDFDEVPPSRAISDHFPPNRESVDIFLALPELRARTRNVAIDDSGGPDLPHALPATRYAARTSLVTDENLGDEEKPVQLAQGTFRVLFEDEYRDGYSVLRIARIIRSATGSPILHPKFVAPCLELASSRYLTTLLRRRIEILATKSAALSGSRRQRGKDLADFSASDTEYFWKLHTVNSFLPELKHIWKIRRGHPESAYLALLRLAGALTTFSLEARAEEMPDYDHADLGACFTLLDERINELLDLVVKEKFIAIPLETRDRLVWAGSITEDAYFRNSQFYLAVSAKIGIDDLIRKVPQLIKVSSMNDIQRLVRNALPGITLRHTPVPPSAIRVKLDNQYFSLNQSGEMWDAIMLSRQIAVHAPGEIVEPKMELIIVLP